MTIEVKKVLDSKLAINASAGEKLFKCLKSYNRAENLRISFLGIELLSSAFLNESIGKVVLQDPDIYNRWKFIYPKDNSIFEAKVEDVIENALLGEKYDHLIDGVVISL